jgi:hypothetical protein
MSVRGRAKVAREGGMSIIQVEKNVPIPEYHGTPKYPWSQMAVGDSFFVPGKTSKTFNAQIWHRQRLTGFKFKSRTMDGGVRVWRIA